MAGARTYRGMTAPERDADRRRRLLDAALELFGTQGYAATSINDVCRQARVTARSFYDHFPTREDLLLELYAELVATHAQGVLEALADQPPGDLRARIRAGVGAAVRGWLADERLARVALLEIVGVGPKAESRRFEVINAYVAIVTREAEGLQPVGWPAGEAQRTAVALVGAVNESIVDWLVRAPADRAEVRELVATLQRVHLAALT